jgi:methionyl-tRNA formyltransferase
VIPAAPWRVVIVSRYAPVVHGFYHAIRDAGHEPVAVLTVRGRYGSPLDGDIQGLPEELDVLIPARRATIAPLLAALEADLAVVMGCPWKIPAAALEVPMLGWINGHPSLLPRHRGPAPMAWAIRNGDAEIGVTFHRMDAELDTGPILAQRAVPAGAYGEPEELYARLGPIQLEILKEALDRLARGDPGDPQGEGEYESFFTDDDADLDLSRPRDEVNRLVWAWRHMVPAGTKHGALLELDGETARVLASSLDEVEGARRIECADGPLWLVRTEPADQAGAAAGADSTTSP